MGVWTSCRLEPGATPASRAGSGIAGNRDFPAGRNRFKGPASGYAATRFLVRRIYFVQGIGEPTEGLIAQPVRSLLKQWGYSTAQISLFATLLSLPWWFKPCYGLLSDFVPLAGYRRRSYLVLSAGATVVGLLYVSVAPLSQLSSVWLLTALLLATVGVAFSDVVADALWSSRDNPAG